MAVDNQSAVGTGNTVAVLKMMPPGPNRSIANETSGPADALQLSRLGGVLNVFSTNASRSFNRLIVLKHAVRDQNYSVDPRSLGQRLVKEMSGQREI